MAKHVSVGSGSSELSKSWNFHSRALMHQKCIYFFKNFAHSFAPESNQSEDPREQSPLANKMVLRQGPASRRFNTHGRRQLMRFYPSDTHG
jgi:hypothetical protein